MRIRCQIILALAILCLAGTAQATDRPWYMGVKAGSMHLDVTGVGNLGQAGVLFGYNFLKGDWGSVAIEAEYSNTVSDGSLDVAGLDAEWKGETLAGCFAYRTPGKHFFKGKAGYVDAEVKVSYFALSDEVSDSDFAAGIGYGWRFRKNTALEIEWTRGFFDEDLDYFSFGITF